MTIYFLQDSDLRLTIRVQRYIVFPQSCTPRRTGEPHAMKISAVRGWFRTGLVILVRICGFP